MPTHKFDTGCQAMATAYTNFARCFNSTLLYCRIYSTQSAAPGHRAGVYLNKPGDASRVKSIVIVGIQLMNDLAQFISDEIINRILLDIKI